MQTSVMGAGLTGNQRHVYFWVSERGFGNEGTVYVVPEQHATAANDTLSDRFADDPDARCYRLSRRDAERKAKREYAGYAHSYGFGASEFTVAESFVDTVAASRWLWDESEEEQG